LLLLVIGIT
jgi:hypothetical protein